VKETFKGAAKKLERLRCRVAAAQYVKETYGFPCSPKWFAKLAVIGGGPEFRRAGRTPLYPEDALDTWAESRLSRRVRSTAELPNITRGYRRRRPTLSAASALGQPPKSRNAKRRQQHEAEARERA
jgi:hypothetical protein